MQELQWDQAAECARREFGTILNDRMRGKETEKSKLQAAEIEGAEDDCRCV